MVLFNITIVTSLSTKYNTTFLFHPFSICSQNSKPIFNKSEFSQNFYIWPEFGQNLRIFWSESSQKNLNWKVRILEILVGSSVEVFNQLEELTRRTRSTGMPMTRGQGYQTWRMVGGVWSQIMGMWRTPWWTGSWGERTGWSVSKTRDKWSW